MNEAAKPPRWVYDETVEVTCVAHRDDLMVFMFWRAAAGFSNQQDMFVLTTSQDGILINGHPADISLEAHVILCRMTDELTMNPNGIQIGQAVLVEFS